MEAALAILGFALLFYGLAVVGGMIRERYAARERQEADHARDPH